MPPYNVSLDSSQAPVSPERSQPSVLRSYDEWCIMGCLWQAAETQGSVCACVCYVGPTPIQDASHLSHDHEDTLQHVPNGVWGDLQRTDLIDVVGLDSAHGLAGLINHGLDLRTQTHRQACTCYSHDCVSQASSLTHCICVRDRQPALLQIHLYKMTFLSSVILH